MVKKEQIKKIKASPILNSKGALTVKVELIATHGRFLATVPSGTSKGKYEAREQKAAKAMEKVNKIISPLLVGQEVTKQKEIDELLIKADNTKNKSALGANALLAVSLAVLRAGAKAEKKPLWQWISLLAKTKPKMPYPLVLQAEGGLHGQGQAGLQEFMVAFSQGSFKESFSQSKRVYSVLKKSLLKKYGQTALGLEGAFLLPVATTKETLIIIRTAVKDAGFEGQEKIFLDAAASAFFKKGKYRFEKNNFKSEELLTFYLHLLKTFPEIISLEDPFAEEDWPAWRSITSKIKQFKDEVLIVGDDLTVTNPARIKLAQRKKACNALIVKPNQIGTVSETIAAAKLAKTYNWKTVVSHRSGETRDDFIADLAVGLGADFIKSGAPSQPERMAKYQRLLKIEKEING